LRSTAIRSNRTEEPLHSSRRDQHFYLFNNTWGTNYIMWFGEDISFRFLLAILTNPV